MNTKDKNEPLRLNKPLRLIEILQVADTLGLDEKEKTIAESEYWHGCESCTVTELPGLVGVFSMMYQKEDAGFLAAARYVKKTSAAKDVRWPVVEAAQYLQRQQQQGSTSDK